MTTRMTTNCSVSFHHNTDNLAKHHGWFFPHVTPVPSRVLITLQNPYIQIDRNTVQMYTQCYVLYCNVYFLKYIKYDNWHGPVSVMQWKFLNTGIEL